MEKDLILEQVNRLIERLSTKVDGGKDDTLALAKKVNDLQNRIKDITRKMMATLSELTIHQSDALKLQQEKNLKDVELQQSYERMEQVRWMYLLGIFNLFSFCKIRENLLVRNWNRNGNDRVNWNTNAKLNEKFEKKFVTL